MYLSYSKHNVVVFGFFLYYALIGAYWCIGATVGDTILLSWLYEQQLSLPRILPWVYISIAVMSSVTMFLFDRLQNYFDSVKLTLLSQLLISGSMFRAEPFHHLKGVQKRAVHARSEQLLVLKIEASDI